MLLKGFHEMDRNLFELIIVSLDIPLSLLLFYRLTVMRVKLQHLSNNEISSDFLSKRTKKSFSLCFFEEMKMFHMSWNPDRHRLSSWVEFKWKNREKKFHEFMWDETYRETSWNSFFHIDFFYSEILFSVFFLSKWSRNKEKNSKNCEALRSLQILIRHLSLFINNNNIQRLYIFLSIIEWAWEENSSFFRQRLRKKNYVWIKNDVDVLCVMCYVCINEEMNVEAEKWKMKDVCEMFVNESSFFTEYWLTFRTHSHSFLLKIFSLFFHFHRKHFSIFGYDVCCLCIINKDK